MKKGKGMYSNYQKKGETGKEYTQDEADFKMEAVETSWPNLKTFYAFLGASNIATPDVHITTFITHRRRKCASTSTNRHTFWENCLLNFLNT